MRSYYHLARGTCKDQAEGEMGFSVPDRLISFDFSDCKFKRAFSNEKVYVRLGELYLECDIFSSIL